VAASGVKILRKWGARVTQLYRTVTDPGYNLRQLVGGQVFEVSLAIVSGI
jgi:hypothetical protein